MKNVIAIFDIGKTNKKVFLFDQQYAIVFEKSVVIEETTDEDGDPCEDIAQLRSFLLDTMDEILERKEFDLRAINFSGYGASFVYVDENGKELTPLYNYLKKYPAQLQKEFYDKYGGEDEFSHLTASPVLGSLNSGLQLYRMKYEKPAIFKKIQAALHLPQYLSYLFTGKPASDMTSIGSHTGLWDFTKSDYHEWVYKEGVNDKLPPILPHSHFININYKSKTLVSGIGLHDSSAALIPYLVSFGESFVLISSGTWNITLSPFNHVPLSTEELQQDCLCYFSFWGKPVKASRLFSGHQHEEHLKELSSHFNKPFDYYQQVGYDPALVNILAEGYIPADHASFESYEQAYHHMILGLIKKQVESTDLVMTVDVKHVFVDGGFSKNPVFMNMLAALYPGKRVYAASISQSSALGAALAMHKAWNDLPAPQNMISLKSYFNGPGPEVKQP